MNKIILFTQPECPPCDITKLFLKEHGFSYLEKNIKNDKTAQQELVNKYQSYSTPTIIINGTVVRGFNLEELQKLLNLND